MKILYLCSDPGIPVLGHKGGAVHVRELIAAFRRAGHEVVVTAQVLQKNIWQKPVDLDATVLRVPMPGPAAAVIGGIKDFEQTLGLEERLASDVRRMVYNRELIGEVRRQLEQFRPDFIYERASLMGIAGVLLGREWGAPLLLEVNAPVALEQGIYRSNGVQPLAVHAERWLLSNADAVLVVSSELKRHVLELGVRGSKVHIVPNGVDPLVFCPGPRDPAVRARLGLHEGPVIGFVGGLRDWHGVESLPFLLARLIRKYPTVQMLIVGDGPMRPILEGQFRKDRLSNRVRLVGSVPHAEIPAILRHLDIGLAPYPALDHRFYFSPLKLFEYMACAVPVVAADAGQISEIVRHGKTGLLYKPGDMSALVKACDRLLSTELLRRRIAESACAVVHQQYTWDHNARTITDLANRIRSSQRSRKRPTRNSRVTRRLATVALEDRHSIQLRHR